MHDDDRRPAPPEPETQSEPAPDPDRLNSEAATGEAPLPGDGETDPLGQPVGRDNIREGRVTGVMTPPAGSHGEGQGG